MTEDNNNDGIDDDNTDKNNIIMFLLDSEGLLLEYMNKLIYILNSVIIVKQQNKYCM